MLKFLFGIKESISTASIIPVPPHIGQAPDELNAYSSAPSPENFS